MAEIASIELRRARPDEAAAIAGLIRTSKAEAMPWLAVVHTSDEESAWVANVLLPGRDVRVALVGGELAGVLALAPGWVEQLYVATKAQSRGVGRALLDEAKRLEPEGLCLWTFQRNVRARVFYERAGFVAGRETGGDNEEREPDVLYTWRPSTPTGPGRSTTLPARASAGPH
ncbi:MAG TPA: GNAT family N-acetyltransferase [Polyangiaceae bacterium]|nr:GNAT family N-acetyltransferase [Polyangiaceae bacterium]